MSRRYFTVAVLGALIIALSITVLPVRAEQWDTLVRSDDDKEIKGRIIEETDEKIVIRLRSGMVATFSRDEISEIHYGDEFKRDFLKKWKKARRANQFYKLGKWCKESRMYEEARMCFERVIEKKPDHKGARKELGFIHHLDKWYTELDFYTKVKKMVLFRGAWVTPGSKAEVLKKEQEERDRPSREQKPKKDKPDKDKPKKDKPHGGLFKKKPKKEKEWIRQAVDYSMYEDFTDFKTWEQAYVHKTKHFRIKTSVSPKVAKYYGNLMEAFYKKFMHVFRRKRDFTNLNIKIYGKHEEFMRVERKPAGVGGYFGTGRGIVCFHGRFGPTGTTQTVLSHEGTHYFQSKVFGASYQSRRMPIWAIEGMAVFFEASEYIDGNFNIGIIPQDRLGSLQNGFSSGKYIKFDTLLNTPQSGFRGYHYAHAWAINYYLLYSSKENQKKFDKYLQKCSRGGGSNKDFFEACKLKNAQELEDDVKEFILRLHPDMSPKDAGKLYKKIQEAKKAGKELPPIQKWSHGRKIGKYKDPSGRDKGDGSSKMKSILPTIEKTFDLMMGY